MLGVGGGRAEFYHRSLKFYQSNRKKEALRMIVSIYNIEYIYCILILSYVKLPFYDLIDNISNSCGFTDWLSTNGKLYEKSVKSW